MRTAQDVDELLENYDRAAKHLDEWGSASISSPVFTLSTDQFKFNLNVTPDQLFSAARIAGAARLATAQSLRVGVAADVNVAAAGQTPTTAPSLPTTQPAVEDVGALGEFLAPFSGALDIDPGRRGRLAASEWSELQLHKFLSSPEDLNADEEVAVMAFTVNCRPGWRTSGGDHIAQVDVRLNYVLEESGAREATEIGLFGDEHLHPRVVSVYPAFGTQELDLRFSRRELFALALHLAIRGHTAAAQGAIDFARRLEQDAQTATGLSQVISYSQGGRHFGYEFHPAFQALREPGSKRTRPGFRLEATTFPAFALVSVNRTDFETLLRGEAIRRVAMSMLNDASASRDAATRAMEGEKIREVEDEYGAEAGNMQLKEKVDKTFNELRRFVKVRPHITHTWRPRTKGATRFPYREAYQVASDLDVQTPMGFDTFSPESQLLAARKEYLHAQLVNRAPTAEFDPFPTTPPKPFQVTDVEPREGRTGRASLFLITGAAFPEKVTVSFETAAGSVPVTTARRFSASQVLVTLPAQQGSVVGAFRVRPDDGNSKSQSALTPPVTIYPDEPEQYELVVTRPEAQGGTVSVRIPSGTPQQILDALTEALRSMGCLNAEHTSDAEIRLDVRAREMNGAGGDEAAPADPDNADHPQGQARPGSAGK